MKTITIKTSKYNEVSPESLGLIMANGGRIIKSNNPNGKLISREWDAYSDDDIKINNVILPLSIGDNYCCELTLNVL